VNKGMMAKQNRASAYSGKCAIDFNNKRSSTSKANMSIDLHVPRHTADLNETFQFLVERRPEDSNGRFHQNKLHTQRLNFFCSVAVGVK